MLPASTRVGAVHLTIQDLDRSVRFYQAHLGFEVHRADAAGAALGAGGPDLLVLTARPTARRVRGTTGLYHFAVLVPSRADLARSLRRLVETRTVLQGAADHGVSEALYLADPDGNGIEIYRDRPRADWPFVAGGLRMGADPLDFDDLFRTPDGDAAGLARDTTIGHVHLHVSNLVDAEHFYVGVLGFALTQRYGPSALFVAAGGYHHHVGLNTWAGVGAPPAPPDSIGLDHFVIELPAREALDALAARAAAANLPVVPREGAIFLRDPAGNGMVIKAL